MAGESTRSVAEPTRRPVPAVPEREAPERDAGQPGVGTRPETSTRAAFTAAGLLRLQGAAGNRSVTGLLSRGAASVRQAGNASQAGNDGLAGNASPAGNDGLEQTPTTGDGAVTAEADLPTGDAGDADLPTGDADPPITDADPPITDADPPITDANHPAAEPTSATEADVTGSGTGRASTETSAATTEPDATGPEIGTATGGAGTETTSANPAPEPTSRVRPVTIEMPAEIIESTPHRGRRSSVPPKMSPPRHGPGTAHAPAGHPAKPKHHPVAPQIAKPPARDPDPLNRWKAAASAATGVIAGADLGGAAATPGKLAAQADTVDQQRRAARPDFGAEARGQAPAPPQEPPREKGLDTGPADAALHTIEDAGKQHLPDQTFPAMKPLPGYQPKGATALPPAAPTPTTVTPPAAPTSADPKADEIKTKVAAVTPAAPGQGPAEPVTLHDKGAASLAPPSPAQAESIGDVLARVKAKVPAYANEFTTAGAGKLDPGHQVAALTGMATAMSADQQADIAKEIDGVATAAGVSAEALAAKVAAQQAATAQQGQTVAANLDTSGTAATAQVTKRGEEETTGIAGARAAVDEDVDRRRAAADGAPDPAVIESTRDSYLTKVEETKAAASAAYRAAGETRIAELTKAATDQKSAYRREAQAEAARIRGLYPGDDSKGRVESRPVLDWSDQHGAETDAVLARLTREANADVATLQNAVTAAATTARDQIRDWAATKQGRQRSWWDRLLDMFKDWAAQTKADTKAWEAQRNAQTRDAIASDFTLLVRLRDEMAAGNKEAVAAEMSRLSADQRAVVVAFLQSGGKDPIGAVATGLIARLKDRRVPEIAKALEDKAIAELGWEDLNALGRVQNPGFDAGVIVRDVRGSVKGWGTDEKRLFTALGGRTPIQVAAMRKAYAATYPGRNMDEDIADDLSGSEQERADALLSGDSVAGAVATLNDAMDGIGTDEATIMQTLRGKSPAERDAIIIAYKEKYGVDLTERLADDMSGNDLDQAKALLEGDTAKADAIAVNEAMDGIGTDEAGIHAVYAQIRDEVEAQARAKGMTTAEVEAEIRRRTAALRDRYGAKYGAGDPSKLDADFVDDLSGGELALVRAEQDYDQTAIDAAKIQVEHESFYTDDDKVNAVLKNQYERAHRDVMRDLEVHFNEDPANQNLTPEQRREKYAKLKADAEATIAERAKQNMADLQSTYDEGAGTPGAFDSVIALETSGYSQDEAYDLIAQGGKLSDAQTLKYAVFGAGTDEEAIKRTLKGKSKAEIEQLKAQYRELTGNDLYEDLDGDLGGRDWADTRLMLNGTKTPEEQMAYLHARKEWELNEGTGVLGGAFDDEESDVLTATTSGAGDALREYEQLRAQYGENDPRTIAARERFERWSGYGDKDIEEHRAAVDSVTDTLATVAAVAAGVVVTVVSGGAAAPLIAAAAGALGTSTVVVTGVAAAVAATAASIGTRYLGKGAAYGMEDFATDLAQGAVEGIAAAATAGLGAKAIDALLKSPAFAILKEAAESGTLGSIVRAGTAAGLEGAMAGLPAGMAGAVLNEHTWASDDPLGAILKAGAVGAGTGFGAGFAMGGLHEAFAGGGHGGIPEATGETRTPLDEIVDKMPDQTVMQGPDPTSAADAQEMYRNSHAEDPTREAAIYRNTETGEYIVIQGEEGTVMVADGEAPQGAGRTQRWKEILDGADVGSWELQAHTHPINPATGVVDPVNMLPSGANGDMGVMYGEALGTGEARSSRIDYTTADGPGHTDFGYDPKADQPFWVDMPDGAGGRQVLRFDSLEAYHDFMANTMNAPQGTIPDYFKNPTAAPVDPNAPEAAGRPRTRVEAEDNSVIVSVEGEIENAIPRQDAPGYEKQYDPGSAHNLPDYQRAHMWGPGFGDEVADGIMLAHQDVNLKLQNSSAEEAIRELHKLAAADGGKVLVKVQVQSHPRVKGEPLLLKNAAYHVTLVGPDGAVKFSFDIDIGPIGRPGTPSASDPPVSVTVREGRDNFPQMVDLLSGGD
jgi:Bacterial toxin 4/Annexin